MKRIAYYLEGRCINIGKWDLQRDAKGVVQNPLPKGAVRRTVEVVNTPEGRFTADNYSALRAASYPSIGDQLDALFKAGLFPEELAAQIAAVKTRYPKPTTS